MCAASPFRANSISLSISCRQRSLRLIGATIKESHIGGSEYPESKLKKADASTPNLSLQLNNPMSVYNFAVDAL